MFISLNRKILYTIAIFFILTCIIFVYSFYIVYGQKFQEEGQLNLLNTRQFTELNFENVTLRQELNTLLQKKEVTQLSPNVMEILRYNQDPRSLNEITIEHKRVEDIIRNYNSRYNSFARAGKVTLISTFLIVFMIITLGILLRKWILEPIDKLSHISALVAAGNLSQRVELNKNYLFEDEIDKLAQAFNQMLENLNNSFNEIKQKEKFQQALINSIPDGIRVIDKDYNIILANNAYYKQIGSPAKTDIKCYTSCQGLSYPCPESNFSCPLREIKEKQKNSVKVIQQFQSFPNRHLSINAAPLTIDNAGQKEFYIVEAIRDLSDDIKFSHQQKLSSLGFLSTSIAHEMKNNLGSIRMIIENILNKYYINTANDNEAKKYLAMILEQITTCLNIPERLLKLAQNVHDGDGPVDCLSAAKEIAALLDYEAKHKGIDLKIKKTGQNIYILGNASDFKMLLLNLLQNAIKATGSEGKIKIDLKNDNTNVTIKIQDTGHGISARNLPHIFEPFYSEGQKDNQSGTGLGLAIVKSIVEKFNGNITVKSKEGKGTEFTLEFPQYKPGKEKKTNKKTAKKTNLSKKSIA